MFFLIIFETFSVYLNNNTDLFVQLILKTNLGSKPSVRYTILLYILFIVYRRKNT